MRWGSINLEQELRLKKEKHKGGEAEKVLKAFRQMLDGEDRADEQILSNIFNSGDGVTELNLDLLDYDRVFHEEQIKKLCTEYRLRFLNGSYFKGEVPYEAIAKVKRLQRNQDVEIENFKILAPAPMFNLEKKDSDPLLFVSLGRGMYYLVHKWGNDLSPFRKLAVWPFRNFKSLLACVAGLALLIVMMIPDSVYMGPYDKSSGALRVIFFFYLFIAFSGLTALYGFSRLKNFNSALWNSRYFD